MPRVLWPLLLDRLIVEVVLTATACAYSRNKSECVPVRARTNWPHQIPRSLNISSRLSYLSRFLPSRASRRTLAVSALGT